MQAHSFAAPILKEFVKGAKETHDTYETGHVVLLEPASKTLEKHIGVDLNDLEQVKDLLTGIQKTKVSFLGVELLFSWPLSISNFLLRVVSFPNFSFPPSHISGNGV